MPPPDVHGLRRLGEKMGTPALDLEALAIALDLLRLIPEEVMRRRKVLPLRTDHGQLFVAVADARNGSVIDEIAFRSGHKVIAYVAPEERLLEVIEECIAARRQGETAWR